jgi:hypothetical protein
VGEAQHDEQVAALLAAKDVLGESARVVIERALGEDGLSMPADEASALLVGPVFFWILSGRDPQALDPRRLARRFLADVRGPR